MNILCKSEEPVSIKTSEQERTKTNLSPLEKQISVTGSQHEGEHVNT